jgi:type I restriction enzyme S subunit
MSEWIEYKLGDLGTFFGGVTSISKEDYGHGYPFLQYTNVYKNWKVDVKNLGLMNVKQSDRIKRNCLYGDIFFTASSETDDEVAMSAVLLDNVENLTFNGFCKRYRLHNFQTLLPEFALYLFRNKTFRSEVYQRATGDVRFNISQESLAEIPVILPPLPEQKAIASVLSSLDDKIDLLHRQNETLEELAETIFRQWFVEEAQDDWNVIPIKELDIYISDFVANGSFASLKKNVTLITEQEEYALFVRNTDLKSRFIKKTFVNKHAYHFLEKTKLFGGEVIISNVGDVGSVFRCPYLNRPMTLGNNMIMIRSKYNLFYYILFSSKHGQEMIYSITTGSVQQKFNKTDFKKIKIYIPDIKLIESYENMIKPFFKKIDANIYQIEQLETLRDDLLPKLMSGAVRVNV